MRGQKKVSPLDHKKVRELFVYDSLTGVLRWRVSPGRRCKAGDVAGSLNPDGYRSVIVDGRRYKTHRIAWLYTFGEWPAGLIDHINRDKGDNRISNLRVATETQNHANSGLSRNNTTGAKGVHWHIRDKVWIARIRHLRAEHNLGRFSNFDEAVAARRAAAIKLHGEFYRE